MAPIDSYSKLESGGVSSKLQRPGLVEYERRPSDTKPSTANDRFKARVRSYGWTAAALAIIIHVVVLLWFPPIEVRGASSRMVVWIGPWHEPTSLDDSELAGFVRLDPAAPRPALANRAQVNQRLPRVYPWVLWHHKEPSSALIQVAVASSGKVRHAKLLESSENGGDEALLEVVQLMRFELSELPLNSRGILAVVELTIAESVQ
jgi:hypothetical protein